MFLIMTCKTNQRAGLNGHRFIEQNDLPHILGFSLSFKRGKPYITSNIASLISSKCRNWITTHNFY
ncbi:hypothetical protein AYO71_00735 [Pseudomonas koreensis]|nr:hypothetical protein AYO71_00735 [Pseudomonas koreensis]